MTIQEFADVCDLQIEITYYPNQDGRWCAKFYRTDIKDGCMLVSGFEDGKTPSEAVDNYWRRIRGQRLIVNAGDDRLRREYVVPK